MKAAAQGRVMALLLIEINVELKCQLIYEYRKGISLDHQMNTSRNRRRFNEPIKRLLCLIVSVSSSQTQIIGLALLHIIIH